MTHVYLFSPFPAPVVWEVMSNLRQSLVNRPRPMTIIYKHPSCYDSIVNAGSMKQREFTFQYSHPFAIYTR